MTSLHTITKPPSAAALQSCAKFLSEGDSILLLEDGVYYSADANNWPALPLGTKVYGLKEDFVARGLSKIVDRQVELVDYARFVQLSCEHDKVVSWL
ncbi:MAG TPA: sulfurtransferase complex subunit TusB [Porticoccaceae bacterium]|jgi:tRNA 2-thiouridine synthesizing protein B|nr:sulfurtransferase complex subunit TusB [Gammaproteobacteria bacterium]HIL59559.1 sulfurtransferase complex subunit TusB [Porticoccaceae bacterium]